MKVSEMTNEELASFFEKNSTTILRCTRCGDETPISDFFASRFREATKRLRALSTLTTHTDNSAVIAELQRRLKVAEDALTELQTRFVASVHDGTIDPYEAIEIAERALDAIRGEGGDSAH